MNAHARIIGFISTKDAEVARTFYEQTLGLRFVKDDQFALVFESGGNMIRIARAGEFTPAPHTILGWQTSQIEQDVRDLSARGVNFERYGFLTHNDLGIWTSPSGDKVAWFKDPDGNTLSLSQHV